MNSENRTSSTFRLTATASTLVALVAMSATVATGPAPRAVEVRAVAAAVAAAARDMLVSERPSAAVAVLEPCVATDDAGVRRVVASDPGPVHARLLGERLLDLPPPAC